MNIGAIFQFIIALPKIYSAFLEIEKRIKDASEKRKKEQHEAATEKLKEAEGAQEIKDSFKDYIGKP